MNCFRFLMLFPGPGDFVQEFANRVVNGPVIFVSATTFPCRLDEGDASFVFQVLDKLIP